MPEDQYQYLLKQVCSIDARAAKIETLLDERCSTRSVCLDNLNARLNDCQERLDHLEHSRTYSRGYVAAAAAISGLCVYLLPFILKGLGL